MFLNNIIGVMQQCFKILEEENRSKCKDITITKAKQKKQHKTSPPVNFHPKFISGQFHIIIIIIIIIII